MYNNAKYYKISGGVYIMDSKLSDSQIVSKISGKQRMIKFLNFIHPLLFIAMPAAIFWGFAIGTEI